MLKEFSTSNSYTPEYSTQGTLIRSFNFGVDNSIKFLKSSYTKGLTELRDMTMADTGSEFDEQKIARKSELLENMAKVKEELDVFKALAREAHKSIIGSEYVPPARKNATSFTKDEINKRVKALADSI